MDRFEQDGLLRRFWVGEEPFVERLTYLSNSGRELRYSHVYGIEDAERYDARLRVVDQPAAVQVHWTAEVVAEAARANEIAAGTREIFEAGLAALKEAAAPPEPPAPVWKAVETQDLVVEGTPPLAVTATPGQQDTLVLFLHGIGGARSNWAAQLPVVDGARAAAMDLRGYGGSGLGPEQSTVADHCGDILRVMDALGAQRLILVGLSFGAWIATSFALAHPAPMAGLVLAGGCTGMSEAPDEARASFRAARLGPLEAGQTPRDMAGEVLDVIGGPDISGVMRAELTASMAAIPTATYRDAVTCFTAPPGRFDFTRIPCPVLMMTGVHDRLAPSDEISGVAERIWSAAREPHVQFDVLARAGHVCNLETPEAFNAQLDRFLRRLVL